MNSEPLPEARGDGPALLVFGILAILVCLGLALEAPGILIILLILATPALIRTMVASSREQQATTLSGLGALGTFLSSLGVVVIVGLAAVAAFYATCFVVCLGGLALNDLNHGRSYDWILVASVGTGLIPGIAVAVYLFRRLWSRKA